MDTADRECPDCGQPMGDGQSFCRSCGYSVKTDSTDGSKRGVSGLAGWIILDSVGTLLAVWGYFNNKTIIVLVGLLGMTIGAMGTVVRLKWWR